MKAKEIRQAFKDFFEQKGHQVVASAPMVVKDDPTLMFTNAGMNQFKDVFLGNRVPKHTRVVNSQKCLRVSGKHNDLEEVGHDTYHHTMFEMLGNWSFGDYFKAEAIDWAWEFLVTEMGLDPKRLYATVFGGDEQDGVARDEEAAGFWRKYLPESHILNGNKKDNFWEMGDQGPCGPCSEVHIDLRSDAERAVLDGAELVNMDHHLVIEIWNLVFIQFHRKASGNLEALPAKHVDTGMGFERLCMALQGKTSNYDTDVFAGLLTRLGELTSHRYGESTEVDIAMRVIVDHVRTIAFAIADGQLPSNNKAGYVIRRILRRAVRYAYTFLGCRHSFMYKLIPVLVNEMGDAFPELVSQMDLVQKVLKEEEESFFSTLEVGIRLLEKITQETKSMGKEVVDGKQVFELYDTYGFPYDLTALILKENDLGICKEEFDQAMDAQRQRARNATAMDTSDWTVLLQDEKEEFVGYDYTETAVKLTRYRTITQKGKKRYQLVFNLTPFYAAGGGQVGDQGLLLSDTERIEICDTLKENNVIVHIAEKLPQNMDCTFTAQVDVDRRLRIAGNHTATHLLHEALREVLGQHVEQKGSLVHAEGLRFDFAHFQKMSDEELEQVERRVNAKVRANLPLQESRMLPMSKAKEMGAIALFGEKYEDVVRVIQYGSSIELCGGTHLNNTGAVGWFKIISEGSISSGVRRVEALTGVSVEMYFAEKMKQIKEVQGLIQDGDWVKGVTQVVQEYTDLKKRVQAFEKKMLKQTKEALLSAMDEKDGVKYIGKIVKLNDASALKDLCFQLKGELDDFFAVLGVDMGESAALAVVLSDSLVKERGLNAGTIIRDAAKHIRGGGGGQAFFATAGGKYPAGLQEAIDEAMNYLK